MARRSSGPRGHTGRTERGAVRDVKVERFGRVTIYKRGLTYYLYFRERGESVRRPVDGNLTTARATASKVNAALLERRPSPLGFRRTSPEAMVAAFMDSVVTVQKLALRTQDRYRAALERFVEFTRSDRIESIDAVHETTIEDFVRWLRQQRRNRNGQRTGKMGAYKTGGIRFILSACRTAFAWVARHRMLPPFADNPFSCFGIDRLRDRDESEEAVQVFSAEQEKAFFAACNPWQCDVFRTLATLGLRVGELTHLLVEDVDLKCGVLRIASKPELLWRIKTGRTRELPLTSSMVELLGRVIGERRVGFVFLNGEFATGAHEPVKSFASDKALKAHAAAITQQVLDKDTAAGEREQLRAVTRFCRAVGQLPERRVRAEFMALTAVIGCPEFTRVHDLRHLFTSRAQELGVNPLIVQELLGHRSLDMTRRYTHFGLAAKREAMASISSTSRPTGKRDRGTNRR